LNVDSALARETVIIAQEAHIW